MTVVAEGTWLPVADAALELRRSYRATLDLLLTGKIAGKRQEGRWLMDRESVDQYLAARDGGVRTPQPHSETMR